MIHINRCPLCGNYQRSEKLKITSEDRYLRLIDNYLNSIPRVYYQCNNCSFIYLSPIITESESNKIYQEYRSVEFRGETIESHFNRLSLLPQEESEAYQKAVFIKQNTKKVNFALDIGCGIGIMIYQLQKVMPELDIEAIEPNKDCYFFIKKNFKIKIYHNHYKVGSTTKKYDLLIVSDVIEHIHYLKDISKAFRTNLKRGGYLFLVVPSPRNFDLYLPNHEVFNACHLYYFNEKNINQLLNNQGFVIVKKQTELETGHKDLYLLQYQGR